MILLEISQCALHQFIHAAVDGFFFKPHWAELVLGITLG